MKYLSSKAKEPPLATPCKFLWHRGRLKPPCPPQIYVPTYHFVMLNYNFRYVRHFLKSPCTLTFKKLTVQRRPHYHQKILSINQYHSLMEEKSRQFLASRHWKNSLDFHLILNNVLDMTHFTNYDGHSLFDSCSRYFNDESFISSVSMKLIALIILLLNR